MSDHHKTQVGSLVAEGSLWAVMNAAALAANVPWVPILSAVLTLAPSLFRYLEARSRERSRVKELTRELIEARAKLDAMAILYADGKRAAE